LISHCIATQSPTRHPHTQWNLAVTALTRANWVLQYHAQDKQSTLLI
jgi:hypothetical protein